MKDKLEAIVTKVANEIPEWSYWESHKLENAIVDEGEYIKSEDALSALYRLANEVVALMVEQKERRDQEIIDFIKTGDKTIADIEAFIKGTYMHIIR